MVIMVLKAFSMRMQFKTIDAYVNSSNERAKLLSVYVIKSLFVIASKLLLGW